MFILVPYDIRQHHRQEVHVKQQHRKEYREKKEKVRANFLPSVNVYRHKIGLRKTM